MRLLYLACVLLAWGCATGVSSDPDGSSIVDAPPDQLDLSAPDLPTDTARPDTARPDTLAPDTLAPDTLAPDTLAPDTLAPDLCGPCGPGMVCGAGGCVCDPATCAGCCAADSSACHAGNTASLCGGGGATCQPCQTSDSCLQASCATGTCTLSANPNAPYPCPGAYGSPCGGSTGLGCLNSAPCATFSAGATGFCSRYCTWDSDCTSNAPSGTSPACNLLAGSQNLCGFECFPGTCPSTMSCDTFEGLCKP